jgi:hypothetical protein
MSRPFQNMDRLMIINIRYTQKTISVFTYQNYFTVGLRLLDLYFVQLSELKP